MGLVSAAVSFLTPKKDKPLEAVPEEPIRAEKKRIFDELVRSGKSPSEALQLIEKAESQGALPSQQEARRKAQQPPSKEELRQAAREAYRQEKQKQASAYGAGRAKVETQEQLRRYRAKIRQMTPQPANKRESHILSPMGASSVLRAGVTARPTVSLHQSLLGFTGQKPSKAKQSRPQAKGQSIHKVSPLLRKRRF